MKKFKQSGNVKDILKVIGKKKIDPSYLKEVKKGWKKWRKSAEKYINSKPKP